MRRLIFLALLVYVGYAWMSSSVLSGASDDVSRERRLTLAPGGRLSIDADGAAVAVDGTSGSGGTMTVSGPQDLLDKYDLTVDEQPGGVRVRLKRRSMWSWMSDPGFFRRGVRIAVRVPSETAVDVHTAGGSVHAAALTGNTTLRTAGGSIEARDIRGKLFARTAGGSVHVESVTGDVEARTAGGAVEVQDAGGRVDAHTAGGSVRASFARGVSRGGDLSTSGGSIEAAIDPAVSLDIDASTTGGRVHSSLPVTTQGELSRRELRGTLNGGGAMLRLHTVGGGIRILASASR